ncbi:hypothetical protein ACA910_008858 [Epithemia clementina (nom. ined.)]
MEPTTATSIAGVINATSSSFLSSSSAMSLSERSYLLAGCRANCRVDGRTCTSYRPYILQIDAASQQQQQQQQRKGGGDPGLLPLCHGSARLMGSTGHASHETQHLLCTVKADLVRPLQQQPNHGMVELHVHFSGATAAAAASSNQSRRDSEQEVQAILSQLLLNNNDTTTTGGGSWLVDTRALCLQPGTLAWRLAVDVYILEAAGGCLIDCAAQLICATLLQATWLPNVAVVSNNSAATTKGSDNTNKHGDNRITSDTIGDGGNPTSTSSFLSPISFTVDGDWAKAKLVPGLPCNSSVMIVTVAVLLDYEIVVSTTTHHSQRPPVYSLLVDPNAQEEACAMTLVHVALQVAEVGTTIVGLSKTQSGALPMNLLPEITKTAVQAVSAAQRAFVVQQPLQLAAVPASSHQHERGFTNTSNANHHPSTLLQEQFEWRIPSLD